MTTTMTPTEKVLSASIAATNDSEHAIAAYRRTLAAKVEQGRGAEDLASLVNDIARHEAAQAVFVRVAQMLDARHADATLADVTEMLFDMATAGADDTWSGRGNDLRRSQFDGRLSAIARVRAFVATAS